MPLVVCARSLKAELQTGDRECFLTSGVSAVNEEGWIDETIHHACRAVRDYLVG